MNFFFFILLIPSFLFSQQVEITSTTYSIISGYTSYYQMQDRENYKLGNPIYKEYNKSWHTMQTLEAINLINVGIIIESFNKNLPGKITDIFLTGAIRWLIRDGTYNLLQGNSFFYQSNNTTSFLESIGTPIVKISFLVAILTFKYFFLPDL